MSTDHLMIEPIFNGNFGETFINRMEQINVNTFIKNTSQQYQYISYQIPKT